MIQLRIQDIRVNSHQGSAWSSRFLGTVSQEQAELTAGGRHRLAETQGVTLCG